MRRLFALILALVFGSILFASTSDRLALYLAVNLLSFSNGRKMPAPPTDTRDAQDRFRRYAAMVPVWPEGSASFDCDRASHLVTSPFRVSSLYCRVY